MYGFGAPAGVGATVGASVGAGSVGAVVAAGAAAVGAVVGAVVAAAVVGAAVGVADWQAANTIAATIKTLSSAYVLRIFFLSSSKDEYELAFFDPQRQKQLGGDSSLFLSG